MRIIIPWALRCDGQRYSPGDLVDLPDAVFRALPEGFRDACQIQSDPAPSDEPTIIEDSAESLGATDGGEPEPGAEPEPQPEPEPEPSEEPRRKHGKHGGHRG